MYRCPCCGRYMSFKMRYSCGNPVVVWHCSCGYRTFSFITIFLNDHKTLFYIQRPANSVFIMRFFFILNFFILDKIVNYSRVFFAEQIRLVAEMIVSKIQTRISFGIVFDLLANTYYHVEPQPFDHIFLSQLVKNRMNPRQFLLHTGKEILSDLFSSHTRNTDSDPEAY